MKTRLLGSIVVAASALLLFSSCFTGKDTLSYFQDAEQIPDSIWNRQYAVAPTLQPNDEISIIISSIDRGAALPFNKATYTQLRAFDNEVNTVPTLQTYRVDDRGNIDFPVLGTIHVQGMQDFELKKYIEDNIKQYLNDALVSVSRINFNVTVLGEVMEPGVCKFEYNHASILEAIGMCKDLTIYGERRNVLLIREVDGRREQHRIDLTSAELINSPYYYLKQNDVIYVSPNKSKRESSKYNNLKSYNVSLVSTIVSCISVLTSLCIAIWR